MQVQLVAKVAAEAVVVAAAALVARFSRYSGWQTIARLKAELAGPNPGVTFVLSSIPPAELRLECNEDDHFRTNKRLAFRVPFFVACSFSVTTRT